MVDALKTRRVGEVLNEYVSAKKLKPVEWGCVLVRLMDCQRDGELEDVAKAEVRTVSAFAVCACLSFVCLFFRSIC